MRVVRRFTARSLGEVAGACLTDGIHRMVVTLKHDGRRVLAVRGRTLDYPWSTCIEAPQKLQSLVGAELSATRLPGFDQQSNCTHLVDLARLAMAQALRAGRRRYRVVVHADADNLTTIGTLARDGVDVLEWTIREGKVCDPPLYRGHSIDGRAVLPDECLADPELFEAAMMLRRAVKMFSGLQYGWTVDADSPLDRPWMSGACYSYQPNIAVRARRSGCSGSASSAEDMARLSL